MSTPWGTSPARRPRAGVIAEGEASTVADVLVARITGGSAPAPFAAEITCYIEMGGDYDRQGQCEFPVRARAHRRVHSALAGGRGGQTPIRRHTPEPMVRPRAGAFSTIRPPLSAPWSCQPTEGLRREVMHEGLHAAHGRRNRGHPVRVFGRPDSRTRTDLSGHARVLRARSPVVMLHQRNGRVIATHGGMLPRPGPRSGGRADT